jgi:hypothetical protein
MHAVIDASSGQAEEIVVASSIASRTRHAVVM